VSTLCLFAQPVKFHVLLAPLTRRAVAVLASMVVSVANTNQSPGAAKSERFTVICENAVRLNKEAAAISRCFFIYLNCFLLSYKDVAKVLSKDKIKSLLRGFLFIEKELK
jgi:hypothetical protein